MKKLTLTFAAACCFALWSAQAQAVELLDIFFPRVLRPIQMADEAAQEARDDLQRTYVPPAERIAQQNGITLCNTAHVYFEYSGYCHKQAVDTVAIIAILHPLDPRVQKERDKFEAYRRASYGLAYTGYNQLCAAGNQPSSTVRARVYVALPSAKEAVQATGKFMSRPVEDLVDEINANGSDPGWNDPTAFPNPNLW